MVRNTSDVCTLAGNGTAVTTALGAGSPNYACLHGRMESATMWLGIAGFCISAIMLQRRVKVCRPLGRARNEYQFAISWMHAAWNL